MSGKRRPPATRQMGKHSCICWTPARLWITSVLYDREGVIKNMVGHLLQWVRHTFCDPTIFWSMVTAIGTLLLAWIAWKQLSGLAQTSRADFIFRLKSEFFNPRSKPLLFLIEEDLIDFILEGETGYFVIKDANDERVKSLMRYFGFTENRIPTQEIDDLILGILEDVGMFQRKGVITLEDVYGVFDTYVVEINDNPAIREYMKYSRGGRGNADVWAEFRMLVKRLKVVEPRMRTKYGDMLKKE
jgi:hypothetical protein